MKRDFFKQKVILFFGYNGKNYCGLQCQKGSDVVTVESKLYQALFDANLVGKATFGELYQLGWSRGARTDKGVHALCNAVSMKLWITRDLLVNLSPTSPLKIQQQQIEQSQDIVQQEIIQQEQQQEAKEQLQEVKEQQQEVKEQLQGQQSPVKVPLERAFKFDKNLDKFNIDFKKVINLINSCLPNDIRVYACKLVTQTFDVRKCARCRLYEYIAPMCVFQPYEDLKAGVKPTQEQFNSVLERLRGAVKRFEGTKNFHNYSRGLKAKDATATRFIMQMEVEPIEFEGTYFFRFKLTGQSFVYHQIRKMVGMCIQLYQEELPDSFIDNTFYSNQLRVLLAPAEGLFLHRIYFDSYNKKADIPAQVVCNAEEDILINEFRPLIEEHIFKCETESKVFTNWLTAIKEKNQMEESDLEGVVDD